MRNVDDGEKKREKIGENIIPLEPLPNATPMLVPKLSLLLT